VASIVSGLTAALGHLSGWVAIVLIAALVFGETAIFLGFVLPGEAAVVFGGVLASRGQLSLPLLVGVVVVTAVTGPLVGYEIGKRMGDRLFAARTLRRVSGPLERARIALRDKGGVAVLGGRFLAIVRALMPAAAGAAEMPYRVFAIHNLIGGVIWGVGYSLLGYLAGSAYGVVERTVGAGLAIAIAVLVVGAAAVWAWRRHRRIAGSLVADEPGELAAGALAVQAEAVAADSSGPEANETQACEPTPGPGVD
jgi:membrane-associated protein